ncbi:DUF4189 domain-containing protein [Luteibacter sp.]|uniref:DUF4189 domain-containing protein n=1 Tax=Luteibacter sp. TaxID=1886636 RepID=UPI003F816F51
MARIPIAAVLFAVSACTLASGRPPTVSAPPEVVAAAPAGTTIVAFASSGGQPEADAAGVFESAPDNDVRYRTLVVFGKREGTFVPEFANEKIIGCSKCTQFHDDPFWPKHLEVIAGHILIDQFDSGQKPSTTTIELVRKDGAWRVSTAERQTVEGGDGATALKKLPLPASGLAKDFDGEWGIPVVLNTLMINHKNGKFMLYHGGSSSEQVWQTLRADCNKLDCTILVQQQDGCISLVKDADGRFFGAGAPDPRDKKAAIGKAMDACNGSGGKQCEAIRTDCNRGI